MFRTTIAAALLSAGLHGLAQAQSIVFAPIVSGGLASPVDIAHAGDGSGRLFVAERAGRIRVISQGQLLATTYLDIAARVKSAGDEQGLLGIAFHPAFKQNGRLFACYTRTRSGDANGSDIVLSTFTASPTANSVDAATEQILLTIPHPNNSNHNGGQIRFGPDGYLYIGVGDGGSGNDPPNNGQSRTTLLGKLLRIDVNAVSATGYSVPPDNPYPPGNLQGFRPEIYAYGLRNPWRFSFDRGTGDLFIGDVGQNTREEIDLIAARSGGGHNFGWRGKEGTLCTPGIAQSECGVGNPVDPILEYAHDSAGGQSVTGGFRYRASQMPAQAGRYLYADFISGNVWSAAPDGSGKWVATLVASQGGISAWGEDEAGELYVTGYGNGRIFRVLAAEQDTDGDGIPNALELTLGTQPLTKDNDIFAATSAGARLFVQQQYRDFLAREADSTGLDYWSPRIAGGQVSRIDMVDGFFASAEFQGVMAPVTRLFLGTFLRIPDYAGLQFWAGELRRGTSLSTIAQAFAQSAEFATRYGALADRAYVAQLYRNILGREADTAGLDFWEGELKRGATRGDLLAGFTEASEYQARVAADVFVTAVYAGMLRRAPDSDGYAFWVGRIRAGQAGRDLIGQFLGSSEYHTRFLP